MPTFNLYPNPSNQDLTVELSVKLDEKVTVSITDAMGRTVISKTLNPLETELNFNTEKLADGFYNVVLNTGNVLSAKPFLVKH
jgi:subtilase family serine protease